MKMTGMALVAPSRRSAPRTAKPFGLGHDDVAEHHVREQLARQAQAHRSVGGAVDRHVLALEHRSHEAQDRGVVVNDQDSQHSFKPRGILARKRRRARYSCSRSIFRRSAMR